MKDKLKQELVELCLSFKRTFINKLELEFNVAKL